MCRAGQEHIKVAEVIKGRLKHQKEGQGHIKVGERNVVVVKRRSRTHSQSDKKEIKVSKEWVKDISK